MPRLHGIHILVATSRTLKWCRDVLPDSLPRSMGMRRVWASCMVSDLSWQTLQKRRQNARLAVFHRAQSGWPGLSDVVLGLRRQSRPTRSSSDTACTYSRLQTRTDCYKFSFLPRTITDWDSLDAAVRGQRSLASFRQLLGGCPVGASCCKIVFHAMTSRH